MKKFYCIRFGRNKNDKDYIYLCKNGCNNDIYIKCLTWLELYYYIRDNNIDFKNIVFKNLDLYKLFYHFMNFSDMEEHYKLHKRNDYIKKYNSSSFNENFRI